MTIGISGSSTHERDWRIVSPALHYLAEKYPYVRFEVSGFLPDYLSDLPLIFVKDDPEEWIRALEDLVRKRKRLRFYGAVAEKVAREHYSLEAQWKSWARAYEGFLADYAKGGNTMEKNIVRERLLEWSNSGDGWLRLLVRGLISEEGESRFGAVIDYANATFLTFVTPVCAIAFILTFFYPETRDFSRALIIDVIYLWIIAIDVSFIRYLFWLRGWIKNHKGSRKI
ncbi:MAG: hypothetical protein HPY64_08170 [Anaerolineae bacterium]|nr:hypothetical protein [Anaerolineae bacterium]